jgi:hypothetical protein
MLVAPDGCHPRRRKYGLRRDEPTIEETMPAGGIPAAAA